MAFWMTVDPQVALEHLRAEEFRVWEEDVARLSPLGSVHLCMGAGRYSFEEPDLVRRGELRDSRELSVFDA